MHFIPNGKSLKRMLVSIILILILIVPILMVSCSETSPEPSPSPAPSPAPAPSPVEPKYHWRFQSHVPDADLDYHVTTVGVAEIIERVSEGQIQVDTFPVGALVAPEEMFSALVDGAIEMGIDMTSALGEMVPTDYCTALPGSAKNLEEYYDLCYRTGLLDIFQQDFQEKGVHLLAITLGGPDALRSSFSLRGWDDLKGKKGWSNPSCVDIITQLGGVCVEVPGYDMYSAMKLGTIEWHGWTVAELESMGYKEVTDTMVLDPILKIASNNIFVNKEAWDALDTELQDKISDAVIHGLVDLGLEYRDYNYEAIAAAKEYGVEFVEFSEADIAKYIDLCIADWDRVAEISPRTAECIEIAKDWMRKMGRIE